MAEAEESAGHDRWGDTTFTEALGLLIESCRSTGRLNAMGWRVLRSVLLRHLRNRLSVEAFVRDHPEAAERSLESPLVITGLPRTGTSLLHNLLAQDPRHRYLALWQALHPVPPGGEGSALDEGALVQQAERWLERFYALAPDFRAVHPLTPRGPEECDSLLQNALASQHFDDMFDAEAYSRWFRHDPLHGEYDYYALQLRVLGSGARRWLLKSPGHIGHLDALLRALPDATVLHCHRAPAQAVPSYASLITTVRGPHSDHVSPTAVGEQALDRCATALGRALAVRTAAGNHHFVDVSYPALVADPIGTVGTIYDRLGTSLDEATAAAMRAWVAGHPADRHGAHRYDPDHFALPAGRVDEVFADYRERFGDLLEA